MPEVVARLLGPASEEPLMQGVARIPENRKQQHVALVLDTAEVVIRTLIHQRVPEASVEPEPMGSNQLAVVVWST